MHEVAFSLDGVRLLMVELYPSNAIRLWDLASEELIAVLSGHRSQVLKPEFSPDGTRIATASYDRTIRLWDSVTGGLIAELSGHQGEGYAIASSLDSASSWGIPLTSPD